MERADILIIGILEAFDNPAVALLGTVSKVRPESVDSSLYPYIFEYILHACCPSIDQRNWCIV